MRTKPPRGGEGAARRPEEEAARGALSELDAIRAPLFRELSTLLLDSNYHRGQPAHACCRRALNQMRISPLEASAIQRAFRDVRSLRAKLPAVLDRLRREVQGLEDSTRRQNFDCPLLEGTRCLVHEHAKPIGCTAWNPGRDFTRAGWKAFARRDELNDRVHGPNWKLRVIPLWLRRVFAAELRAGGPEPATPRSSRSKPSPR